MAVYGNMLNYFPELMRQFDYFSMKPQPVASYSKREDLGKVTGVFQFVKKGELRIATDTIAETEFPTFWTKKELVVGNFMTIEGTDYRICNDFKWMYEGEFRVYGLETFVGNSDKQEPIPDVKIGPGLYA